MAELTEQSAGAAGYRREIRAGARGLWVGALDYYQAYDSLFTTISNRIPQAWHEGAKTCGILPSELSPIERQALQQAVTSEISHIDGLLTYIEEHSKAKGGKLGVVGGTSGIMVRVEMWVNRYTDVVNHAKVMACADQKLKWVLHGAFVTKEPCNTCANKLNGKVKRASYWQRVGVRPQNPPNWALDCGGWGCGCAFLLTDEPLSRGPLPKLP